MDYDIIVIGGGMAGMSAALTAARGGESVLILTGGVPGGELLNVENITGLPGHEDGIAGYDLCPITQELAAAEGARFVTEFANAINREGDGWSVTAESGAFSSRAVILALGARPKKLGVPGEAELAGKGVSLCASCDGPLLRGKAAVVAGGGDSGMQEALTLADHVQRVILVERSLALSGQAAFVAQVAANPKIEVLTGRMVTGIEGADRVSGVRLRDMATAEESLIEAQGIFPCIGLAPSTAPVGGLVELDGEGRVKVDAALRTSARGVFAAGNLRAGNAWRAVAAMGDGATAAYSAARFCADGDWPAHGP